MSDKLLPCDILGNEVAVGDAVKFMQIKYRSFMDGTVKSLAPKSALISHERTNDGRKESRQSYDQIISLTAIERKCNRAVTGNPTTPFDANPCTNAGCPYSSDAPCAGDSGCDSYKAKLLEVLTLWEQENAKVSKGSLYSVGYDDCLAAVQDLVSDIEGSSE